MFCANMDLNPQCQCLPGFATVRDGNDTAGCERNFTAESCKTMDSTTRYNIQPVLSTIWEDSTYSTLTSLTSEECAAACQQDCNCEAVTYDGQSCNKQRLPLRFGRRVVGGNSNSGLYVKVGDAQSGEKQVNWDVKMGLALHIARGLLYLHEECETQIIHCDVKPQNILIDDNLQAKISDFGLSKLLKPDQTNTTTGVRGTKGYVAPEWHKNMPVTVKVDIYSFGVVLLEIICSRRNVDWSLPEEEAVLEEWVYSCFQAGELDKLVDYQTIDKKQLDRMVKVALWCILEEPSLRPSMRKVLLMLEGTVDVPIPPCPTSFLSVI
ncbi:G-type lectin S-receptor-like serine/threonine-protein kinase LECRK1 [Rhodamnia argentea]|uniref:G-type lectin S-receptor-like serine/threonine-protein kinase LECRK1 n=1 Tax=Rhodamnia argentea TaxID=178133 RepID=A0ABM3HYK8_9MYRT|nr:G-type lectin S-receptor-like serine/threonine-protein kinase LECRK1 [Rhodamnia argentea]